VLLLLIVVILLLLLRLIVVIVVNNPRLPGDRLEGVDIDGRYYPVEKVCLVLDDGALAKGLKGSSLDRGNFSLIANANGFGVNKEARIVGIDCGWKNWEYDTDPQVFFYFSAAIHADRIDRPACSTTQPGRKAETGTLGRFTACRQTDGFEVSLDVVDDNADFGCDVKSRDGSLLPALERAMRGQCEYFIDLLARSRPISYWGNGFWTVR